MPDGSRVRVEFDLDELVASYVFDTQRSTIDSEGAKGIWNGFGQAVVKVNDHAVLALHIHEDNQGEVVLDVTPLTGGVAGHIAHSVWLEHDGIVPSRTKRKR